jgi:hypothetical protein
MAETVYTYEGDTLVITKDDDVYRGFINFLVFDAKQGRAIEIQLTSKDVDDLREAFIKEEENV